MAATGPESTVRPVRQAASGGHSKGRLRRLRCKRARTWSEGLCVDGKLGAVAQGGTRGLQPRCRHGRHVSGPERTNHGATAPPTYIKHTLASARAKPTGDEHDATGLMRKVILTGVMVGNLGPDLNGSQGVLADGIESWQYGSLIWQAEARQGSSGLGPQATAKHQSVNDEL